MVENDVDFGAQNVKEEDSKGHSEDRGGNGFQAQNNESNRKVNVATELNSAREERSKQEICGWSWKESVTRGTEEQMGGTDLQKNKKEAGHHSKTEDEADPGRCEAKAEGNALAAEDGGTGAEEDKSEVETGRGAENSRERKHNYSDGVGCRKERIKAESSFVPQEDLPGEEINQESFEAETNVKVKNLEIGINEEKLDRERADMLVSWERPEKARRKVEENLWEEYLQRDDEVLGRGKWGCSCIPTLYQWQQPVTQIKHITWEMWLG
ncbi:hypothetical protein JRQ81_007453 [Phrynocephalus forsythii]|uniref:Uncharacterized protein n=1 Tax=Phrynocephalus forsythii TaxID=171643 RepID=A0A9Q0XDF9_9SAUR|nr:hypothetical protein JRQ81_007453 [Phrynocephalus forsythii]